MVTMYLAALGLASAFVLTIHGSALISAIGASACFASGIAGLVIEQTNVHTTWSAGRRLRIGTAVAAVAVALLVAGSPDPLASWIARLRWTGAGFAAAWGLLSLLRYRYLAERKQNPRAHSGTANNGDSPDREHLSHSGSRFRDITVLVSYPLAVALYLTPTAGALLWANMIVAVNIVVGLAAVLVVAVRQLAGRDLWPPRRMGFAWFGFLLAVFGQLLVSMGRAQGVRSGSCWGWLLTGGAGPLMLWFAYTRPRWSVWGGISD